MERTDKNRNWNNEWNHDEAGSSEPGGADSDRVFSEFQRAVENRLEKAILERIESFRKDLLKIKKSRK